jgi:Fe-S oxidoreductase
LGVVSARNRRVAYHSACSMQHGQGIHAGPKRLLAAVGFEPLEVPEGHLCCGSAGTYNILQPKIAAALQSSSSTGPLAARSRKRCGAVIGNAGGNTRRTGATAKER